MEQNSFLDFKINMYKVLLPFIIIATLASIILERISKVIDTVNKYALPILFIWLIVLIIILYCKSSLFRYLENINLFLFCSLFLVKFWYVINYDFGINGFYYFGPFFNWLPLLFIYIYFTLTRKRALSISFLFLGCTFLIGIHRILFFPVNGQIYNPIVIFYLSNLVYVLALFYLQKLKEVFIHSDAIKKSASIDFLTNLPNRKYMHELLQTNIDKNTKLSIILLDIDNFKRINDTFGHDVGDIVLKDFSNRIRAQLAKDVSFGRWGGEEFLIIAPHRTLLDAKIIAEEIQKKLESSPIGEVGTVTASFGISEFNNKDVIQSLLKRADKALYQAKNCGKNQIICSYIETIDKP